MSPPSRSRGAPSPETLVRMIFAGWKTGLTGGRNGLIRRLHVYTISEGQAVNPGDELTSMGR